MPRMTSGWKVQIALVSSLCWAVASFGVSVVPFFSDADDMASASAYHDIRHLLSETPPESGPEKDTMAYFDAQWVSLNRTRAWHAATSILLGTVTLIGLRQTRGNQEGN